MKPIIVAVWIAVGVAVPAMAGEDTPLPPLDLRAALARAAERPGVVAARREAEGARIAAPAAGVLPDPRLRLGAMNLPWGVWSPASEPMAQYQIAIEQPLPYPGKLDAARRARAFDAEARQAAAEDLRLRLLARTARAWAEAAALERALAVIDESLRALNEAAQAARARYRVGEGLQQDALLAELERQRMRERRTALAARLAAVRAELAGWVGLPPDGLRLARTRIAPERAPDGERLVQALARRAPRLRARLAEAEAAAAAAARARLETRPDFVLGASYGRRPAAGRRDLVSVWLSISLPLYAGDKQEREAAEAEARADAARHNAEELRLDLVARIRSLSARTRGALAELAQFDQALIPQAEQTVRSMQIGYGVGKVDFLNYVRAIVAWNDLRVRRLMLAAQARSWAAEARALAGLYPLDQAQHAGEAR